MKNDKKKVSADVIAKALTTALTDIAKSAIQDSQKNTNKDEGEGSTEKNKEMQKSKSNDAPQSVEIKFDEAALSKAIATALKSAGVTEDDSEDKDVSEEKISEIVTKAAKELGIDADKIQMTVKGLKKSKTKVDEDEDDEDDELINKLAGNNDDYESDEYSKKFSKMSDEEKDAELDNYFGDKLKR
jgi:hypothetical protein